MQWSHKGKLQKNKQVSFPAHQDSAEWDLPNAMDNCATWNLEMKVQQIWF